MSTLHRQVFFDVGTISKLNIEQGEKKTIAKSHILNNKISDFNDSTPPYIRFQQQHICVMVEVGQKEESCKIICEGQKHLFSSCARQKNFRIFLEVKIAFTVGQL